MKKILSVVILVIQSMTLIGAAGAYQAVRPFLDKLSTMRELNLDPGLIPGGQMRGPRYIWTLKLDAIEPLTKKTYRQLIEDSLNEGKAYKLAQLITFDPSYRPYAYDEYVSKHYSSPHDVISNFVDGEALFKMGDASDAGDIERTAIDRSGSNLEIEQAQIWLIPSVAGSIIFDYATLDKSRFFGFLSENPDDIPPTEPVIGLINRNVEVIKNESLGKVYPYLVDVLPLATREQETGLTFEEILNKPEFETPDGKRVIVRALIWNPETKHADIQFYDGSVFDALVKESKGQIYEDIEEEQSFKPWGREFFKIQRFEIDPLNNGKAYLIDEYIKPGYNGRGQFYFQDQDYYSPIINKPKTYRRIRAA